MKHPEKLGNAWEKLISDMKKGSSLALSRMITRIECRESGWMEAMRRIYPDTGHARIIGITGPPGAGKSTLTNQITKAFVDRGKKVGVIAVDPSSPFSGGAILGDRIRMTDISGLEGVFIRSMATRGALGGLNQSAKDVAKLMDAFGKDIIIIETVGVGQDEVEVVKIADVVLVVCVPGQGDAVQAIKAGVMEIAGVYVVNKADREGADQVVMDIRAMIDLGVDRGGFQPPIIKTVASRGEGIGELVDAALHYLDNQDRKDSWREERVKEELIGLLEKELLSLVKKRWNYRNRFEQDVKQVLNMEKDPYTVVQDILKPLERIILDHRSGWK